MSRIAWSTSSSPAREADRSRAAQAGTCDSIFSYPMFRDLERVQTVLYRHRRAPRFRREHRAMAGASEGGDADTRVRFVFLRAGAHAASRPAAQIPTTIASGKRTGRRAQLRLLARRFGARSDIVGQTVLVNGQTLTIVGVAPRDFTARRLAIARCMFVPISMREIIVPRWKGLDDRRSYWAYLFARLKPGIHGGAGANHLQRAIPVDPSRRSMCRLQQGMSAVDARALQRHGDAARARRSRSEPHARRGAAAADAAVRRRRAIVLLICCANVANLLLGRAARALDGDGGSPVDRRRPQTHRRPAAHRIDAPRRDAAASAGFSSRAGP